MSNTTILLLTGLAVLWAAWDAAHTSAVLREQEARARAARAAWAVWEAQVRSCRYNYRPGNRCLRDD